MSGEEGYYEYVFNTVCPTEIIWYGSKIENPYSIAIRFPTTIDLKQLAISKGYKKVLIVLNDLDESLELTDDNYDLVYSLLANDKRYNFVYLGKNLKYIAEMLNSEDRSREKDLSVAIFNSTSDEKCYFTYGVYTKNEVENNFTPLDAVLDSFATRNNSGESGK